MERKRLGRVGRATVAFAVVLAYLVAPAVGSARDDGACSGFDPGAAGSGFSDGKDLSPAQAESVEREFRARLATLGPDAYMAAPVTIPVHFHVIAADNTAAHGNISDKTIADQIAVLNKTFYNLFTFTLASTDRTVNPDWYYEIQVGSPEEKAMKTALRKGGAGALNIYTAQMTHPFLGWATFPWDYKNDPQRDGVMVYHEIMPGGNVSNLNTGKITAHEVGHWLGLYHTFQGKGCEPPGDYVDDTPAQDSATSGGCPAGKDSCPQPGADPIHNHMDYSNDNCRTMFTTGQKTRMAQAWQVFRGQSQR